MIGSTQKFERDGLTIQARQAGQAVLVEWRGVSDSRDPAAFLAPYLNRLLAKLESASVVVDFTRLEYMNSATVSPIIRFIRDLDETAEDVLVHFSDADWQLTHLRCMKAIARTLKRVRVEGRSVLTMAPLR